MTETTYNVMKPDKGVPIKAWTKGVPLEDAARQQLLNVAQLPVHLQVGGSNARRALGHRRNCGQRDPNARRDHSSRSWRGQQRQRAVDVLLDELRVDVQVVDENILCRCSLWDHSERRVTDPGILAFDFLVERRVGCERHAC